MVAISKSRDFWAGLLLIAIGTSALAIARNYPFGNALRMGPAFFPVILGGLLVMFGLAILLTGVRVRQRIEGRWSPRALIGLPLSLVAFGALIEHGGFIPAMIVLIAGSALAGNDFRFFEVLMFALGLTALCVAVFIWGLGLPYPLLPGFF